MAYPKGCFLPNMLLACCRLGVRMEHQALKQAKKDNNAVHATNQSPMYGTDSNLASYKNLWDIPSPLADTDGSIPCADMNISRHTPKVVLRQKCCWHVVDLVSGWNTKLWNKPRRITTQFMTQTNHLCMAQIPLSIIQESMGYSIPSCWPRW